MKMILNVEKVREYMQIKGWSDDDLAEKIGISRTQVFRVLKGIQDPGNKFIAGLLDACREMGLNDLFIFDKELPHGNENKGGTDEKSGIYL
ncbi:helix-turn-helix transcriptional regulator [Paenibacillus sp. D9]|uniref:helix-turn-helix transcriptional regulator n=1 Tax=Paenibacillus sp. D9 TaxID=665792 RepID=UPI000A02E86F|nr:helix-turn-helix transcriptional regulator [Paenibacillus sp. D9]